MSNDGVSSLGVVLPFYRLRPCAICWSASMTGHCLDRCNDHFFGGCGAGGGRCGHFVGPARSTLKTQQDTPTEFWIIWRFSGQTWQLSIPLAPGRLIGKSTIFISKKNAHRGPVNPVNLPLHGYIVTLGEPCALVNHLSAKINGYEATNGEIILTQTYVCWHYLSETAKCHVFGPKQRCGIVLNHIIVIWYIWSTS